MASDVTFLDGTLNTGVLLSGQDDDIALLRELDGRVGSVRQEQDRFRDWCDRADKLYYADEFSLGGADLWAYDPEANLPGHAHVSINTPAAYVDIPAALQSVEPEENMLATDTAKSARDAAAHMERLYYAWKRDVAFPLLFHKACTVKALYGRTAAKVTMPQGADSPRVEIVDQPRNLYLGWRSNNYDVLEWAAYVQLQHPNWVVEQFGVDLTARDLGGNVVPWVTLPTESQPSRSWLQFGEARIEVWDYWYRRPKPGPREVGKPVKMETWNVVIAGNAVVQGPNKYEEYEGKLPYVPLMNTYVPGTPTGRPELYDMEPLIREKYERVTSGSQMITDNTGGNAWQLTGQDAPTRVPAGMKPEKNKVLAPGPGNRIETITPFIAQFQLEQFLTRLDREMAVVSGLNDLLLGLAPAQVLSSSKAINALIANYESRLAMRRGLLYEWRKGVWHLVVTLWKNRDKTVAQIVKAGGATLDITDPSLSPKDEMETATRAANLVNAKLWSQRRGMNATGVEDPETEQDMIREERTDATLWPQDVQVMAQLMAALQSLQLQPNQQTTQQAGDMLSRGQSDLRNALGAATPEGTNASQGPEMQGITPPEAGGAPFAQPPAQAGPGPLGTAQTMISGGKASSRILTQQQLGRR